MKESGERLCLAVDSSGDVLSVALWRGGNLEERRVEQGDHASRIEPVVEELLRGAGLEPADVACLAVNIGPGSFTGLRIGLAFLKGFAFCAGIGSVLCVEAPVVMAMGGMSPGEEAGVVIPVHARSFFVCRVRRERDRVVYVEPVHTVAIEQMAEWLRRQYLEGRRVLASTSLPHVGELWRGKLEVVLPTAVGVLEAIREAPRSVREEPVDRAVPYYVEAYKGYL